MKYIIFDSLDGTILGLENEENYKIQEDNWLSLSDEAYDYILKNNGTCFVDLNTVDQNKADEYRRLIQKAIDDKTNTEYKNFEVINMDNITEYTHNLVQLKNRLYASNIAYCRKYIEEGIRYKISTGETKKFTFKSEDQINFLEIVKLFLETSSDETLFPIKASEDEEYLLLSVKEIKDIYKGLIINKYYYLTYTRVLNDYIKDEITEIPMLYRTTFDGTKLPDEYYSKITNMVNIYKQSLSI